MEEKEGGEEEEEEVEKEEKVVRWRRRNKGVDFEAVPTHRSVSMDRNWRRSIARNGRGTLLVVMNSATWDTPDLLTCTCAMVGHSS